jgi:hypothetical protein
MELKDAEHTSVFVHELRTALAQPEPFTPDWASYRQGKEDGQREWVGLTDDDIFKAILPLCDTPKLAQSVIDMSMDEYRAIEAKLKEKNT